MKRRFFVYMLFAMIVCVVTLITTSCPNPIQPLLQKTTSATTPSTATASTSAKAISPSTVTAQSQLIQAVQSLENVVASLGPSSFNNPNTQNALLNQLKAVIKQIQAGDYADAQAQLNEIVGKTSAWITNPTDQTNLSKLVQTLVVMAGPHTVTYNGNGATGVVPTDSTNYQPDQPVTVSGNTGNLVNGGYIFGGWNTASDGSGTTYTAGQTFPMGVANVTLYAVWIGYTVTYNGNGNATGSVPGDSKIYQQGQPVTVLDNTGNMVNGYLVFSGWSTQLVPAGTVPLAAPPSTPLARLSSWAAPPSPCMRCGCPPQLLSQPWQAAQAIASATTARAAPLRSIFPTASPLMVLTSTWQIAATTRSARSSSPQQLSQP